MNRALLAPLSLAFVFLVMAVTEMAGGAAPLTIRMKPPTIRSAILAQDHRSDAGRDGDAILARPLFSADRRPASQTTSAVAAAAPPRLSAILLSGNDRRVMFDDDGKPLLARVGGRAGPYVVQSIAADRVLVMSADGPRMLRPTPIPAATDADAQRAADPVSGLSLLQQLQRGQTPHYAVPPPPTIQSLIARMRGQH